MACFTCHDDLAVESTVTRHYRPCQLIKCLEYQSKTVSSRPKITILDGLEMISDGKLSVLNDLDRFANRHMCYSKTC